MLPVDPYLRLADLLDTLPYRRGMLDMDFKDATDLLAVSLEEVAKATSRSYATTLAYRNGARVPPAQVLDKLAAFMRNHSRRLAQAADELGTESTG